MLICTIIGIAILGIVLWELFACYRYISHLREQCSMAYQAAGCFAPDMPDKILDNLCAIACDEAVPWATNDILPMIGDTSTECKTCGRMKYYCNGDKNETGN